MRRVLLLFALLPLLPGCRTPDYTPEEEAAAREIMFGRPFYDRGKGTPAEFVTNQRGQYNPYGAVLRGEDLYPEAVKTLARIRNEAELGFQWKHPVPVVRLPRLAAAPRIDGTPEAAEWRDALRFSGEFVMNRNGKTPQSRPSLWLAGWRDGHLYVAVRFPDEEIHAFREPGKRIYLGDSLELFVRPDKEEKPLFRIHRQSGWGALGSEAHLFRMGRLLHTAGSGGPGRPLCGEAGRRGLLHRNRRTVRTAPFEVDPPPAAAGRRLHLHDGPDQPEQRGLHEKHSGTVPL